MAQFSNSNVNESRRRSRICLFLLLSGHITVGVDVSCDPSDKKLNRAGRQPRVYFLCVQPAIRSYFARAATRRRWISVSLTEATPERWMHGRSKESHLFPLTRSVKWIEAEPFDLAPSPPPTPHHPTHRVHTALAITANREGDGSKILSR